MRQFSQHTSQATKRSSYRHVMKYYLLSFTHKIPCRPVAAQMNHCVISMSCFPGVVPSDSSCVVNGGVLKSFMIEVRGAKSTRTESWI